MYQTKPIRLTLATAVLVAAGAVSPLVAAAPAAATAAKYSDDFNGDGYRDYAQRAEVNVDNGGTVLVTYGTATGPGTKTQLIDQDSPGVPGAAEDGDDFGGSLAHADLNSDGYADLVVGVPWEDVSGRRNQGGVTIVWGSASGLSGGTVVSNKYGGALRMFGSDVATGDFNGDGKADIAALNDRYVYVYRGGFGKSGTTGSVSRYRPAAPVVLEPVSLVAGKVTKDSATDLVVLGQGYPDDNQTSTAWFLRGGSTISRGKLLHYNGTKPNFHAEGVIADFNKDGYGDIALEDPYHSGSKGAVTVWRGGSTGPGSTYRLSQSTAGVEGTPESGDHFGGDISTGDVNGDGYPDLAIGAPAEDVKGSEDAGIAHILRGGSSGLTGANSQFFTLNSAGVPGTVSPASSFGAWLRLRDANRDGKADLFVYSRQGDLFLRGNSAGISGTGTTYSLRADFAQ